MKKRNILKRNSGFIVGCVLVGGASFFAADVVMTDVLPDLHLEKETDEPQSDTEAVLQPEKQETAVYETDPFTVMASGSVIKGVESEQSETQSETQQAESGETEDEQTSGDDSPFAGGETSPDGEYVSDGDDSYYEDSGQPVEIYDSGNGDYSYTDDGSWSDGSGGSDGSWSDGSGGSDGSWSDGSGGDDGSWSDSSGGSDGSWSDGSGGDDGSWSDGSGGSDGSWSDGSGGDNGSWSDGSGGDDGSWSNGSGGDDGSWSNGSGDGSGTDGAWTPEDVIIQGISSRYIDVSELYNYNQGQLRLIRNEIFALHGRIFNSQDLADYFSQKSWYVPTYPPEEFDANMFYYLNDYEEANLQVILDYEAALGY